MGKGKEEASPKKANAQGVRQGGNVAAPSGEHVPPCSQSAADTAPLVRTRAPHGARANRGRTREASSAVRTKLSAWRPLLVPGAVPREEVVAALGHGRELRLHFSIAQLGQGHGGVGSITRRRRVVLDGVARCRRVAGY